MALALGARFKMFNLLDPQIAVLLAFVLPLVGMLGIWFFGEREYNARELMTLLTGIAVLYCTLTVFMAVQREDILEIKLATILPGLILAFKVERLGAMFALIGSGLWIVNSLYSIGYMRGTKEKNQTRFYMCFAAAITAVIGIAYAANLITLFLFYELLSLSTFPLVTHKGDAKAIRGGTIYLGILLGTSIGLFLPAIVWTYFLANTGDFTLGGILSQEQDPLVVAILLGLYAFGIGKAALMPVHPWLPNAMVAPTPVSAFLHAVAVVKAGVFSLLKIVIYIFGIDFLQISGVGEIFMWIAAGSILLASTIAMTKDNLKARLAYSTVSQLSYVTLGAMMATSMGAVGAGMQIATHALGKMTLFMCAGAIYVKAHKTLVSEMSGLGRQMPITFALFFIGAMSIIGLPPLGGSWPKFLLMLGGLDAGHRVLLFVLALSSVLNVIYLLSVPARAFFLDENGHDGIGPGDQGKIQWGNLKEAPFFCLLPPALTAMGCVILFFMGGMIYDYLLPISGSAP